MAGIGPNNIRPGDEVRIGKGRTIWTVQEFWRASVNGDQLATLHNGWNSTTVKADRLVAVSR